MKKGIVFILGIITGVLLTFVFAYLISKNGNNGNDDITWFENPGDVINVQSFKVFQVLDDNFALVNGKSEHDLYLGAVYLLTNNNGKYYYDDEIIKVPSGTVVRQVGVYKYKTRSEILKTVPIIQIMNK